MMELDPQEELLKLIDKVCRVRDNWDSRRQHCHDVINTTQNEHTRTKHKAKLKQLNMCIADMDFIIARNRRNLCAWHRGATAESMDPEPGCQNCGITLSTRECTGCRKSFLDFADRATDDVIARPYVTTSGDLYCASCGREMDRAEEQADAYGFGVPMNL